MPYIPKKKKKYTIPCIWFDFTLLLLITNCTIYFKPYQSIIGMNPLILIFHFTILSIISHH